MASFSRSEQGEKAHLFLGCGCWAESAEVTAHPPQCLPQKPDSSRGHWKVQGSLGRRDYPLKKIGGPVFQRRKGSGCFSDRKNEKSLWPLPGWSSCYLRGWGSLKADTSVAAFPVPRPCPEAPLYRAESVPLILPNLSVLVWNMKVTHHLPNPQHPGCGIPTHPRP